MSTQHHPRQEAPGGTRTASILVDLAEWRRRYRAKREDEARDDPGLPVEPLPQPQALLAEREQQIERRVREGLAHLPVTAQQTAAAIAHAVRLGVQRAVDLAWSGSAPKGGDAA